MADDLQLNPGTGGDLARALDAGGVKTPVSALAFATTVSPGANVIQVVTPAARLPVEIDAGAIVGATQSGAWLVGVDGTVDVAGTVAIAGTVPVSGTVAIAGTVPVSGTVAIGSALPAGTNLIGRAAAAASTDAIYDGSTALVPKFATIAASASGDNLVVAAVTGKRIRVLRWGLTANGSVSAKLRSSTTDLTGARPLVQYASTGGAWCPVGIVQTAVGAPLNLNLSAAVAVGGELTYIEV